MHPEDIEAVEHSISRQIQADRYSMDYVEYRIIRRDGSVRWIEDYGHHVTLDAGEFFYVFINDATDKLRERADELEAVNAQLREAYARELEHRTMLRNALSEAEAANVAKNTFLSNMSHDIRTPLNAVVGYASLISAHGGEAERVRAYSDKVLAASEQLLDVVNETLEISRMEAGHVQLAEAECSLSELVLQARMDMVDLADRADVTWPATLSLWPTIACSWMPCACPTCSPSWWTTPSSTRRLAAPCASAWPRTPARPRALPASASSWPIRA